MDIDRDFESDYERFLSSLHVFSPSFFSSLSILAKKKQSDCFLCFFFFLFLFFFFLRLTSSFHVDLRALYESLLIFLLLEYVNLMFFSLVLLILYHHYDCLVCDVHTQEEDERKKVTKKKRRNLCSVSCKKDIARITSITSP